MWRHKPNKKVPHATTSHGHAAAFSGFQVATTSSHREELSARVPWGIFRFDLYRDVFLNEHICIIITCIYGSIYLLRHHVVFACCNMEMESNSEFQWVVYQCWFFKLWVFPMRPLQHSTSINGSQGLELAIPINEEALPEKKSLNKFGGGWCWCFRYLSNWLGLVFFSRHIVSFYIAVA